MGEVDFVGDDQGISARRVPDRAVVPLDEDFPVEVERMDRSALALEARGVKEPDERKRRTVQDRHLGSVDLDQAVVESLSGRGREQVLDGPDRDSVGGQGRGVVEGRRGRHSSGNPRLSPVAPDEEKPGVGRGGKEMGLNRVARVEANPFDRNACS
jgi:hypothetical protein